MTHKHLFSEQQESKKSLFLKGLLMGSADIIPGVSGGTIALITGIYERLLAAITSVDAQFFKKILKGKFKEALSSIPWGFLIPLGLGIVTAILSTARIIHHLLDHYAFFTWSLFFGLISASIIVVSKEIRLFSKPLNIGICLFGSFLAYHLVAMIPYQTPNDWWFLFLCGALGIMAMILPGISGAFILLIMGKYRYVTGALKSPFEINSLMTIIIFSCGMVVGLFFFSRILKFLLSKFEQVTMSLLTGLMIGSLRKIWPWKTLTDTNLEINILPASFDQSFYAGVLLIFFGLGLVLFISSKAKTRTAV